VSLCGILFCLDLFIIISKFEMDLLVFYTLFWVVTLK
jgi:hypothetical protein